MFPKLISIGSYFLPTYGVLVAAGFLAGLWLTVRLARRAHLDPERVTNLCIYCALAGLAGAKLFMFLFDFADYRDHPEKIFSWATLQAAGVFHGGLLAAMVTAFFYARRYQMPGLVTADVFAPGLALGHAIGRLGCFAAGCCWGTECKLPWAVTFTNAEAHELVNVPLNVRLHPTQLYEALAEAVICLLLLRHISRIHRPGFVIGLYLILSSTLRFLVEFVRDHAQPLEGPFSLTQWIALALLVAGVFLVWPRPQHPKPAL